MQAAVSGGGAEVGAEDGSDAPTPRAKSWRLAAIAACAVAVCGGGVGLAAALGLFDGSERAAPEPVTPVVQSASPSPKPSIASPRPSRSSTTAPQSGATSTPDDSDEEPAVTGPAAEDGTIDQWDPTPAWSGSDNTWVAPGSGDPGYWDNSDGDDTTGSIPTGDPTPSDGSSETPDPEPEPETSEEPTGDPTTDPPATPDPTETPGDGAGSGGN